MLWPTLLDGVLTVSLTFGEFAGTSDNMHIELPVASYCSVHSVGHDRSVVVLLLAVLASLYSGINDAR